MRERILHNNLTDDELLAAYQAGRDKEWLGYLLQRYTALLFGVAMKYLKDKALAEDAVQHIFMKALTHLPEGVQNFKGWLYVIMRNHCLQTLKEQARFMPGIMYDVADEPDTNERAEWTAYTAEQIKQALGELAYEQKMCIVYFYIDKLSYQQITDRTGYTFMKVKSYIQNGKRNLKALLLNAGDNK